MKLLALMTDAYGGRGGIAQYNRDLLGALAGISRFEAIEVLPRTVREDPGTLPPRVRQLKAPSGRLAYVARALSRALKLRPTIIFCGHLNLARVAAFLAKRTGAKLAVQLHGVEAWERPSGAKRRALERADLVLCVSRYTRARFLAWADIAPERVVVVPNTVSEAFAPGDRAASRTRFGFGAGAVLLTVARTDSNERYKGHELMLGSLTQLSEEIGGVTYVVAGDGDDLERLKALAATRGVADRVRFLGYVDRKDLPDLYRAADLFVLPSTGEGFGIAYLEAMACGTPALGLAVAGAMDALGDGELGDAVAAPDLPEALARGLASPPRDHQTCSTAVLARFGRPAFAAQAGKVFRALVAH